MRHVHRSLAALLALGLVVSACGGDDSEDAATDDTSSEDAADRPAGEPIVIGMNVDSTGPGASYSVPARDTMQDAVDEINANGGVLGRPLEVIIENDESDPTRTPSVVRKLVEDGAHVLIMQTGGSAIEQAKPVIQEAGLPTIAPTSLTTSIAEPPDNEFIYILANPIADFVEIYCGAFEEAGIESLGILSDTSPTIAGLNELLVPGLKECVDVVAEEEAAVEASDVTAQVARIGDEDPDAVLVSSVGGGFEVLAQNTLFQQMADTTRFSLAAIGNQPESWDLANPGALEGLIYMGSLNSENELTSELEGFLDERRDDDWAMTAYDAQAYDAIQLLAQAIEQAGTPDDPAAINQALQSITDYEAHFGQPGFTLSYGADKHVGTDGLCGLSLIEFGADNRPGDPWETYQPEC
jgi:branched-chain amino acid transport system substrate-binding protein